MKTKTKTKRIKTIAPKTQKAFDIVLVLDRSGSMASRKAETIGGFNEHIDQLKKKKASAEARFTMVQFDSIEIEKLYDATLVKDIKKLTDETYVPRANTPLYDAVGVTIQNMADKKNVQFTIMTDGEENSSREWELGKLKDLMKECEKKGWLFSFIGVGPDSWRATDSLRVGTASVSNFMNISDDPKEIKKVFRSHARSTVSYAMAVASGNEGKISKSKADFYDKKKS